jgi:erythromycin esterase
MPVIAAALQQIGPAGEATVRLLYLKTTSRLISVKFSTADEPASFALWLMIASRFLRWLPALLFLLASRAAQAQASLNLGLEPRANHGYPLALWAIHKAPAGRVQFDSTVFRQGRGSLHLTLVEEEERVFMAVYTDKLPLDSVRGQLAVVSGWVRTRGFRGRAGFYAFAHTPTTEGLSTDRATALDSLPTDTDWRRLELRLPIKAVAQSAGIGIQAIGSGQVWFDDVQVRVNGRLLAQAAFAGTEALLLGPTEALTPNWDFERPLPRRARPAPATGTAALDSAQPQHGRRYLRLVKATATTGPAAVFYLGTLKLTPELVGKSLQVNGYWRQPLASPTPSIASGFGYALLNQDQPIKSYTSDSPAHWSTSQLQLLPPPPVPGTQWTAFSLLIPIPNNQPELAALALYLRLPGGAVEIDNLSFGLNGASYVPAGPPTPPAPTTAEMAWLRSVLRPLNLAAPATDFQDLAPLGSLVGAARVVGLGEAVPGSHELASLKERLVRYLVSQKGFTGLALDASPASGAALNDYLQTGQGDPAQLLHALGQPWATAELLDLVRWLRSYNQAHPGAKVWVAGLDPQQPSLALVQLAQTVAASDDFAQSRLRQLAPLLGATAHPSGASLDLRRHPDQAQDSLLPAVRRLLAELATGLDTRTKLGSGSLNLQLLDRQRHYLRLVEQGATLHRLPPDDAPNYREACLAENLQYLSQHEGPGGGPAKLLLWGSNALVGNIVAPYHHALGQWLHATYGAGYVALGLAVGQGSYATRSPSGQLVATPLAPAPNGAYEAWLRTGPAAFYLALNKLELQDANGWLFQQQLLRDADWRATPYPFRLHSLRNEFDAVLYWRDSTPVRLLP